MSAPSDRERMDYLKRLDSATFEVSDWEAQFLDRQLGRDSKLMAISFSPKERTIIDGLMERYDI